MNKKSLRWAIAVFAALGVTLYMVKATNFYQGPGKWYTPWQGYKWQIDSFLRGQLKLFDTPFALPFDTLPVWGRGAQQVWGLGVPILETPFELLAKILHWPAGFPDRFLFLIFYFGAALVFWRGLSALFQGPSESMSFLFKVPVIFATFLNVHFLQKISGTMYAMQTASLDTLLYAFAVLGVAVDLNAKPSRRKWILLSVLCSFMPVMRPDYLIHAGVILGVTLIFLRRDVERSWLLAGLLIFPLGGIFTLIGNQIRFGSPSEFGYHLIINDTSLRFDGLFGRATFLQAAREWGGMLFGTFKTHALRDSDVAWWQAPWPRVRAALTSAYLPWDALILVIAWLLPFWASRKKIKLWDETAGRPVKFLWLFSILTFLPLFRFYMYSPTLMARYALDFIPPVASGFVFLYVVILNRKAPVKKVSAEILRIFTAVTVIMAPYLADAEWGSYGQQKADAVDAEHYKDNVPAANAANANIKLPETYACRDFTDPVAKKPTRPYLRYYIVSNMWGWESQTTCEVERVINLFFEKPQCVKIDFEEQASPSNPRVPLEKLPLEDVKMKSNIEMMTRISEISDGLKHTMTFCRDSKKVDLNDNPIQMVSIQWVDISGMRTDPHIVFQKAEKIPFPQ